MSTHKPTYQNSPGDPLMMPPSETIGPRKGTRRALVVPGKVFEAWKEKGWIGEDGCLTDSCFQEL